MKRGAATQSGAELGRQAGLGIWVKTAWFAFFALSVAIVAAGMPVHVRQLSAPCSQACGFFQLSQAEVAALASLGLPLGFYAALMAGYSLVLALVSLALAAVVLWNRSHTRMGVFTSFTFISLGPAFFSSVTEALVAQQPGWRLPVGIVQTFGVWAIAVFAYVFPDGRFFPRWTKVAAIIAALPAISLLFVSIPKILMANGGLLLLLKFGMLGAVLAGAAAQVARYRRISGPVERQQIKGVVFGIAAFAIAATSFSFAPTLLPGFPAPGAQALFYYLIQGSINVIFLLVFVFSMAFAILKYRLWDIDIVIKRTLVYGTLTAVLAAVYFASILFFQGLLRGVMGGDTPLSIVGSTLVIAALFTPLRRRIQAGIDRRFFRRKYDAERTLAAFIAGLGEQVDLDQLNERLLGVVKETMQPETAWLWLKEEGDPRKS
jgi:hypothetical protein